MKSDRGGQQASATELLSFTFGRTELEFKQMESVENQGNKESLERRVNLNSSTRSTDDRSGRNRFSYWSFGSGLFSLFGYIPVIFIAAPFGMILYLFAHNTPTDILSPIAVIFLLMLQLVSIASGLGAIILGIKALFQIKTNQQKGKLLAALGIFVGILGILYHAYTLFKT